MLNKIKSFSSRISGASKGFEIEHQIFNITSFVILLFGIQAGILNYILGLHYMTVVLAIPGSIIAFLIYWKSFNSEKLENKLLIIFVVSTYVILMPMHFFNGGSYGTVFFLMIMLINMFILIGKVKQIFYMCLSLTLAIISLIFIEIKFPNFVFPYKNDEQRFTDFITVLLYTITFTAYIFWMYKKNHEKSRLKILKQNKDLEDSQKLILDKNEKIEALLMEMHHRIKNNLQVVSSLIALQINRIEKTDPQKALIESKNRLDIMSLLHQQLQINEIETNVNFKDFISSICESLCSVFQLNPNSIEFNYFLKSEFITFDKVNSIGLILNELITNSIKYAEPKNQELRIEINCDLLVQNELEYLIITYSDNGSIKINFEEVRDDSLGLKIIQTLLKQLNSEMTIDSSSFNSFKLKIQL